MDWAGCEDGAPLARLGVEDVAWVGAASPEETLQDLWLLFVQWVESGRRFPAPLFEHMSACPDADCPVRGGLCVNLRTLLAHSRACTSVDCAFCASTYRCARHFARDTPLLARTRARVLQFLQTRPIPLGHPDLVEERIRRMVIFTPVYIARVHLDLEGLARELARRTLVNVFGRAATALRRESSRASEARSED